MQIIVRTNPFLKQSIFVYDGNNKIYASKESINELNTKILELNDKYNIEKIIFIGNKNFCKGLGKKVNNEYKLKYNKDIEIDYL